jgi:predicted transcriptional regulator
VAQLDLIAKAMDRDRSYLLNEAVEKLPERAAALCRDGRRGLEASRKGELIDDEEVGRMIESCGIDGIARRNWKQQKIGQQRESSLDDARCQPASEHLRVHCHR